jgi:hypothetical protein
MGGLTPVGTVFELNSLNKPIMSTEVFTGIGIALTVVPIFFILKTAFAMIKDKRTN